MRHRRTISRRCIVCLKKLLGGLTGRYRQRFDEGPADACVFTSRGNYGSTLLDMMPMQPGFWEVSICDACLKKRARHVIKIKKGRQP